MYAFLDCQGSLERSAYSCTGNTPKLWHSKSSLDLHRHSEVFIPELVRSGSRKAVPPTLRCLSRILGGKLPLRKKKELTDPESYN